MARVCYYHITLLFMSLLVTHCAGDQGQQQGYDDQQGYEQEGNEEYNEEGDDGYNQEGNAENSAGGEQGLGNQESYNQAGGDSADNNYGNQAGMNEGQGQGMNTENYSQGSQQMAEGEGINNATEDEYAVANTPSEDQPAIDQGTDMVTNEAAAGSTDYAQQQPVAMPMRGKVMYVRSNVAIYDTPGGNQIAQLEQGDHPLVMTSEMSGSADSSGMQTNMVNQSNAMDTAAPESYTSEPEGTGNSSNYSANSY